MASVRTMEDMAGRKTADLFAAFGPPDRFESPSNYSAIFMHKPPTAVVLVYSNANRFVYIDADGTILGVLPPKTAPPSSHWRN
jgi:hypothetical protein